MPAGPLDGVDAVILAGGLGTRLRSALPDRQKVLAEIGGRPFLELLIESVREAGAKRIILALGHQADQVLSFIQDRQWRGLELVPSVEPAVLGTGGALGFALAKIHTDTVLALNGDSFAAADFAGFLKFHHARKAIISLLLVPMKAAGRYGLVETDDAGSVIRFVEKPSESGHSVYINGGIYLFAKEAIAKIGSGSEVSLEREVFPQYCGAGLYAMKQDVPFIDIGTPESWRMADTFFASPGDKGKQSDH